MELDLIERGAGKVSLVRTADNQALSRLVPDRSFLARGDLWNGVFEYLHGPGFNVNYNQLHIQRPVVLSASGNVPAIELRFMLGQPLRGKWEGIADPVLLRDQFSLSYTPYIYTEALLDKGVYETFDIHFDVGYLQRMAADFPLLDAFVNSVLKFCAVDLVPEHHYCSPAMRQSIHYLLNHPFSKAGQQYLLEAKVIELLLSALEIVHKDKVASKVLLTPTDIEALHEVRRRIAADESIALSYAQLQRCGLNENKLLNGFKELFGTTPYQFHMELKMNKAVQLLLDTTESVTNIAFTIGYHYVSNFSLEFSKRFGCSPGEYRKRGRW